MAKLPEGRTPLTDSDMIDLLRNMAANLNGRDDTLKTELQQTADRFSELTKYAKSWDPRA